MPDNIRPSRKPPPGRRPEPRHPGTHERRSTCWRRPHHVAGARVAYTHNARGEHVVALIFSGFKRE
jgi:hypothetical protein